MGIGNEGKIHTLKGCRHQGTTAFGKRVSNRRRKEKLARKARRKRR